MSKLLFLAVVLAATGTIRAEATDAPDCPMTIARLDIQIPERGLTWLAGEELSGSCDDVPADEWISVQTSPDQVWAHADGPSGSGRFWRITLGLRDNRVAAPARGVCLSTSTIGWRTLQQYERTPLPWVEDLDEDGEPEFLLWDSFPLSDEPSMAEFGLVVWVYESRAEDVFGIDWELTRRMAYELAGAYGQSNGDDLFWLSDLRQTAFEALRALASQQCIVRTSGAR